MSCKIALKINTIKYTIGDNSFESDEIKLMDRKCNGETGDYKEPNDNVIEETYQANSAHGIFTLAVWARRCGFNTYWELDDPDIQEPNKEIEISNTDFFELEEE
jgi:hypothetical protein